MSDSLLRPALGDEAVRVAVGIRLGLPICVPHQCECGELVDAYGIHSFICKRVSGRTARHHALNELVARAFVSAGIPWDPIAYLGQMARDPMACL